MSAELKTDLAPEVPANDAAAEVPLAAHMRSGAISVFVSPAVRDHLATRLSQVTDLSDIAPDDLVAALHGEPIIVELARQNAVQIIEALAGEVPETPLLVIGDDLPGPVVRSMLKMRASDVISRAASPEDFSTRLDALINQSVETEKGGPETADMATCHIFTGACGGAGATTLAIEMACNLAARKPEKGVCLIDLNLPDGMVAAYLEGKAKLDLASLSESPERLDEALLRAYCWEHSTGVTLISAPRDFEANEHVTADAILSLLDVACSVFSHVVVDLPRLRQGWTRPILAAGDAVVIVSEFTVPSLHAAADMAIDVGRIRGGESAPKLVLNRMSESGRSFSVAKASKAIGWPIEATVRSDWKAARSAVNLGMPIFSVQARSPLVKDVEAVVEMLAPAPVDATAKRKRGWF